MEKPLPRTLSASEAKAQATTAHVKELTEKEASERAAKTDRLRAARLERDAIAQDKKS